jgi:hypothetical protein
VRNVFFVVDPNGKDDRNSGWQKHGTTEKCGAEKGA